MPRLSRRAVYDESPFLHVLVQGIAKEFIFATDANKYKYFTILEKSAKKFNIQLLAYCIMGNHAHILLTTENSNDISPCFHEINRAYAYYYNDINDRVGYVFRDRFKTEPIADESYLCTCIRYIHDNPVKAGLVAEAEEYKYSSARNYKTGLSGSVDLRFLKQLEIFIPELEDLDTDFLDDEYECKMTLDEAIDYALKELNIENKSKLKDKHILKEFVKIVQKNVKVSNRKLAEKLGISQMQFQRAIS